MNAILEYVTSHRWAMQRATLDRLLGIFEAHMRGEKKTATEVEAIVEKRDRDVKIEDARVDGGVAIIPISGVIAPHARMVDGISGPRGTSVAAIRKYVRAALGDPMVHTILFDVESPGGSVQGIDDLAEEIRAARESKRVVAHTDSLMASAALWLASQAHEVYATRSADVGSIGVYAVIDDYSKFYEKVGVKTHVISSGGFKGAGIQGTEITDEQLEEFQASIDAVNDLFVEAVAAGRQRDAKHVRRAWNTGQTWLGDKAAGLGLIDGVATFDGLLARLQRERGEASEEEEIAARAADEESTTATEGSAMVEKKENEAPQTADLDKARADGAALERARVKAIREAAHSSQRELADKLCEEGVDAEDARSQLHADLMDRFDKQADEPKPKEKAGKDVDLYGDPNKPTTFGGTQESEGHRRRSSEGAKFEDRDDLATMAAADFTRLVADEWAAREDELREEYTDFNGFHGAMIGVRREQQTLQGVSHG